MPDDHSEVVPLLPIPNRTVKRLCADDSADSRVKVGHRQALIAANAQQKCWAFCFVGVKSIALAIGGHSARRMADRHVPSWLMQLHTAVQPSRGKPEIRRR